MMMEDTELTRVVDHNEIDPDFNNVHWVEGHIELSEAQEMFGYDISMEYWIANKYADPEPTESQQGLIPIPEGYNEQ